MVSPNLLLVRDKVQRFAKQLFNIVQLEDDGDLSVPYESTHIFIRCTEHVPIEQEMQEFLRENEISTTLVGVWAMVLRDVQGSLELFKWIATEGQTFDFGRFKLSEMPDSPGKFMVIFEHNLPGDTLDAGELKGALFAVGIVADGEDENLKARFGGKTVADIRQS